MVASQYQGGCGIGLTVAVTGAISIADNVVIPLKKAVGVLACFMVEGWREKGRRGAWGALLVLWTELVWRVRGFIT